MSGCEDISPYALQVQDDSMEPEFPDGSVIIVDPAADAIDGRYIACDYRGATVLRQLVIDGERRFLKPDNADYPTVEITSPITIHGAVAQKTVKVKGQRRQVKHYF